MITCTEALQSPVLTQIVRVESSGNPFAIGVVGGRLVRQPVNLSEAVATVRELMALGANFSIGSAQINKFHFKRLGWLPDIAAGFDVCTNLSAASHIYADCHARAVAAGYSSVVLTTDLSTVPKHQLQATPAVRAALSCYYSGDFLRGVRLGYVAKVLNEKFQTTDPATSSVPGRPVSMMVE